MTFDQLEIIETIVEKGSFKAAAEHLHRTQPTISIAVKKLEEEFDLLLFSREEYRPRLTEEGKVFFAWAQQCLRSYRSLKTVGKELGVNKVEARLMIIVDPLVRVVGSVKEIFDICLRGDCPTELTIKSDILGSGVQSLINGEADFAIAAVREDQPDIESRPIDRLELVPVVASSLVGSTTKVDLDWLMTKPQIIVTSKFERPEHQLKNHGTDHARDHVHDRAPAGGLTASDSLGVLGGTKKCFVTDYHLKHELIVQGFGWGRLDRHEVSAALADGRLIEIQDPAIPGFTLDIRAMRNRMKPMGPTARAIWARLSS